MLWYIKVQCGMEEQARARAGPGPGPKPRAQASGTGAQAPLAWPKTQGLPARRALGLRPGQGCLGPGSVPWALGLGSKPWALAGRALGPLGLYTTGITGFTDYVFNNTSVSSYQFCNLQKRKC